MKIAARHLLPAIASLAVWTIAANAADEAEPEFVRSDVLPESHIETSAISGYHPTRHAYGFLDMRRLPAVKGDPVKGKETAALICNACHGETGSSPVPVFPNLAGQPADYLYWETVEYGIFPASTRLSAPMASIMGNLTEVEIRDTTAYFASLPPFPPNNTEVDPALADRGREIYLHGDPGKGVPPCQACHGREAEGHPLAGTHHRWNQYPRLRSQNVEYMTMRLRDYRDNKWSDTSNDLIMRGVAQGLDNASIDAVTAWLSTLPARVAQKE